MQAWLCENPVGVEALTWKELPTPEPKAGEVLIEIQAASLNFPDLLIVQNKYQMKPPLPFVPGSEYAGVVEAVGDGVKHLQVGQSVACLSGTGGFGTHTLAPAARITEITAEIARACSFVGTRVQGPMVVTMRPLKAADAIRAVQITSRVPEVHGAPVHIGDPTLIGIHDLSRPDFGDAVVVMPDELPVFWACGVTPQAAIQQARPAFCITHAPGAMLITDLLNHQLASL